MIDLLPAGGERRQPAHHLAVDAAAQQQQAALFAGLEQGGGALAIGLARRLDDFHAQHQAHAAHLVDAIVTVPQRAQTFEQVGALGGRVADQLLLFHHVRLEVIGDANDYVGKGLSGGTIIVRPSAAAAFVAHENTIIGNTVLYGATSGKLFAAGQAGERLCVRNSGATAVVEGAGTNACEYMTGGRVVILGEVGDNFGAGMTGGMAFVYDPDGRFMDRVNPESLQVVRIGTSHWEAELKGLVEAHAEATDSALAARLLNEWDVEIGKFWQVVPTEIVPRLEMPLSDEEGAAADGGTPA